MSDYTPGEVPDSHFKTYIVAGTHEQAERFRRENGLMPREVVEVRSADSLRGRRITAPDEVHYVGSWFDRRDIELVQEYLRIAGWSPAPLQQGEQG